jgi:glycosyltransferase involved in cell wall biosynthesis
MVSIIIPTYNEEAYLPRLLHSIKAQKCANCEVIVADNKSTDRTREIARAHGARVVRGGIPSIARNRGADAARGEYLLFIDADTVLPEGFLAKILARFEKDFVDICIPWVRPIDGNNPIYGTIFNFSNTFFKLMENIQPQGLGICILATKRIHDRIGGFSENQRVSEDFDYINRAAFVGRFRVYTNVFIYHSVRRYRAEGMGALVQKQVKSGFLYLITGKAYDTEEYQFGTFSRYLRDEDVAGQRRTDNAEVKKLLSSFDRQSRRLRSEIEKIDKARTQNGNRGSTAAPGIRGGTAAPGRLLRTPRPTRAGRRAEKRISRKKPRLLKE